MSIYIYSRKPPSAIFSCSAFWTDEPKQVSLCSFYFKHLWRILPFKQVMGAKPSSIWAILLSVAPASKLHFLIGMRSWMAFGLTTERESNVKSLNLLWRVATLSLLLLPKLSRYLFFAHHLVIPFGVYLSTLLAHYICNYLIFVLGWSFPLDMYYYSPPRPSSTWKLGYLLSVSFYLRGWSELANCVA